MYCVRHIKENLPYIKEGVIYVLNPFYSVDKQFFIGSHAPLPTSFPVRLNWKITKKPMLSKIKKIKSSSAQIIELRDDNYWHFEKTIDNDKLKYFYQTTDDYGRVYKSDIFVDVIGLSIHKNKKSLLIQTVLEDEFGNTAESNITIDVIYSVR